MVPKSAAILAQVWAKGGLTWFRLGPNPDLGQPWPRIVLIKGQNLPLGTTHAHESPTSDPTSFIDPNMDME